MTKPVIPIELLLDNIHSFLKLKDRRKLYYLNLYTYNINPYVSRHLEYSSKSIKEVLKTSLYEIPPFPRSIGFNPIDLSLISFLLTRGAILGPTYTSYILGEFVPATSHRGIVFVEYSEVWEDLFYSLEFKIYTMKYSGMKHPIIYEYGKLEVWMVNNYNEVENILLKTQEYSDLIKVSRLVDNELVVSSMWPRNSDIIYILDKVLEDLPSEDRKICIQDILKLENNGKHVVNKPSEKDLLPMIEGLKIADYSLDLTWREKITIEQRITKTVELFRKYGAVTSTYEQIKGSVEIADQKEIDISDCIEGTNLIAEFTLDNEEYSVEFYESGTIWMSKTDDKYEDGSPRSAHGVKLWEEDKIELRRLLDDTYYRYSYIKIYPRS